jgi:hypothetical protein
MRDQCEELASFAVRQTLDPHYTAASPPPGEDGSLTVVASTDENERPRVELRGPCASSVISLEHARVLSRLLMAAVEAAERLARK